MDAPITAKKTEFHNLANLSIGISEMQGWRTEMEDSHIVTKMPSLPDHILFGVFDGHGGHGAAEYAAKHLVSVIESIPEYKAYVASEDKDPNALGNAMSSAFLKLDRQLHEHQHGTNGGDISGCTSVTCMLTPQHFVCANAGDSRCVLGRDTVIPLSQDHKPDKAIEEQRILKAGGSVQWKRVDGDLAVSRAFGDFEYKKRNDLSQMEQKVTCFPDITIVQRTDKDEVLILACDGLWDVMTSPAAVDYVREIVQSGERDVKLIAEEMLDIALLNDSKDNISVIVAAFPKLFESAPGGGGVQGRRQKRGTRDPNYHGNLDDDEALSPPGQVVFNDSFEEQQRTAMRNSNWRTAEGADGEESSGNTMDTGSDSNGTKDQASSSTASSSSSNAAPTNTPTGSAKVSV